MKLRILGCGTSSGVPRIGNDWGACDPAEPRNRRLRVSILIETDDSRILIDTGPDLREQLLAADVAAVDAVIWTHDHADHCHGLDDLRQVYHAQRVPVRGLAREATLDSLRQRFAYAFHGRDGYPSTIAGELLSDRLTIGSIAIGVTDQPHGSIVSAGLRFEHDGSAIVYATDFNILTDNMRSLYEDADVLVIDALRRAPHPTHPTLDQALGWIAELRPKRAILTHMDQSMDYRTLCETLPAGVEPGYDGLEVRL
ncbi:MBL fold metallo-hydrolase [Sphingomonas sp. Leaf33]|uniref:MBL fold metallo-hydrolase n=1 Tax=Sphingomonas sp. Leaf33 TaxID=1736215 RepID=UPI0006FBD562|nr:MBL fold metallo-hydrolase [Sphingomonas sp. Leaf33]KQN26233.1 MBL fold metallo-hydrolase [Sphingomonas sp. Leaf33]